MFAVAAHIRPLDLRTRQRVDVRVGSAPPGAALGTGGYEWQPAILTRPSASLEIMPLDLARGFKVPSGSMALALNEVKGFDLNRLHWLGAPITIYRIDDLAMQTAPIELAGVLDEATPDITRNTLGLSIQGTTAPADKPLLWLAFDGSGGAGGDPAKRGVLKPAGFGKTNNVEPVWFDENRSIGMLDGYGNLLRVNFLGEGRSSYGSPIADYDSYAALAAAIDGGAVPPGRWATCIAEGMVGLGAPAVGVITCDCEFGYGTPGSMCMRALTFHAKVTEASIVSSSFNALDAALGRATHYHTATQRTVTDLIEAVAYSCNATPIVTMRGLIGVVRALGGPLIGTLRRQGFSEPNVTAWRGAPPIKPTWQVVGRAARPARVLERSEVLYADELTNRGRYDPDETYRQGQTVFLKNGSEWLYINQTASSGHAPPDPQLSSEWWRQLQPAMMAGDITYDDGTTIQANQPAEPNADITKSLDLSNTSIVLVINTDGSVVPGQLPATVKATRRRGGLDVSKTTDFALSITGSITATIDNSPTSDTRGQISITAVQSAGTIRVVSTRDNAVLPGTITITRPDPPPAATTSYNQSFTYFGAIKSRTPTYPAAPVNFATVPADAQGRISMVMGISYYFQNEGSPAYDYGSLTAATKFQYRLAGTSAWTDCSAEIVGTEAYRQGNTTTGNIDNVQGNLTTAIIQVTGLQPNANYDAGPLLRALPVASTSKGQGFPSGAFTVRTGP